MKRCLVLIAGILFLFSCIPGNDGPGEKTEADPEFTVKGLPTEPVKAYTSFNLTVTSKSGGAIDFKSDNPGLASITLSGRREYKVQTTSPEKETVITLSFIQDASGIYPGGTYDAQFTLVPEYYESGATMPEEHHADLDGTKVTFTESTARLLNPERGLYRARDFNSKSGYLKAAEVKAERAAGHTLWYIGFYLTDFMEGDISQPFLDMVQATFDALRDGGAKCILRFAYKDHHNDGEIMDPEVPVVLRHVEQLKPLLQKNEDVIFVLQAGFVGAWGEWYYTSHFGFAPKKDSDYAPRKQLTDALLAALPASRQIQLRTPQFKMRMYGLSLRDTITAATAHNGSAVSRLAGHNDCFGASGDDYGTFDNENDDRAYWKADSRYFIMGGETCGLSEYCLCNATLKDLKDYHWTYLNEDYHQGVIKRWKSSNCFNEIVNRLGYRLVMRDLFYSGDPAAGKPCKVTLRFYNTGCAAPMNPRKASLVWVGADGKEQVSPIDSDPRTWHPGWHVVEASFTPSGAKGSLYLLLSDPLLPGRPEYCIALANEGVFDSQTGYNKLFEIK